jgi:phosphate transport system substrate-binding protein
MENHLMRHATVTVAGMAGLAVSLIALAGPAAARDQIRIVGSSTVYPFSTAVAEQFGTKYKFPTPVVESTGSGGGIKLFCAGVGEGHPDITNSSRRIKQSEVEACAANGVAEVTEVKIGYDGIVLANSKNREPMSVTIPQIWLALAKEVPVDGEIKPNPYRNWSEIDAALPDARIEVLGPPPTSGTRDAFVELVMETGCQEFEEVAALDEDRMATVCATMREDGAFVEAGENDNLLVQKIATDPNALGVLGYSFLAENSDKVRAVQINGISPSDETITDLSYPGARRIYMYAKGAHMQAKPAMRDFIAMFARMAQEGGPLQRRGLVPFRGEDAAAQQQQATALQPLNASDLK